MKKHGTVVLASILLAIAGSFADAPPSNSTVTSYKNCTVLVVGYANDWSGTDYLYLELQLNGSTTKYDFACPVVAGDDAEVNRLMSLALSAKASGSTVNVYYDSPWTNGKGQTFGHIHMLMVNP